MVILVGLPGAGKTTIALNHFDDCTRICQDELGSREVCIAAVKRAIDEGKSVIIDRTNINKYQRRIWINLAKYHGIKDIECINVTTDPMECFVRVLTREKHPTITRDMPTMKKRAIIKKFDREYEPPTYDEGFSKIIVWDL